MLELIVKQHGSRTGLLRHWSSLWRHRLGLLRGIDRVDWSRVERFVFVCQGNVCRSPYAEFRARALGLDATSFGLTAGPQNPPHEMVARIAQESQLDLAAHRSRLSAELTIDRHDLLIGMEPRHALELASLAASTGAQVTLLGLWGSQIRPHIEDPFGLSVEYFRTCLNVIDDAVSNIARIYRQKHGAASATANDNDPNWRRQRTVLVCQAESLGGLGAIRSLGRAGYQVHACSADADALGLHSRYAAATAVHPHYSDRQFIDWLRSYVAAHDIRAIIPSEGMLLALRPAYREFAHLLPYGQREETVYAGMSKADVYKALMDAGAGQHMPPSILWESPHPLPAVAELEALGVPLFLKVDASHSLTGEAGKVHKAVSAEDARSRLEELQRRYGKVLIQGFVPGRGVGVFFLWWKGRLWGEFMHRRLHEVPHQGGFSSFRESCSIPEIRDDALAKLRRLNWEGIAMMEYRRDDRTGEFYFMEMNGRFWGSLHLALFAGVDFPALLVDAFFDRISEPAPSYRQGLRCRHTFPSEVTHVMSRLKDRELPLGAKAWSVLEFFLLGLKPAIYSDLLFPGDRMLYVRNLRLYARLLLGSARAKRSVKRASLIIAQAGSASTNGKIID